MLRVGHLSATHGTSANNISTSDGQSLEMSANGLVLLYRQTTSDAWRVLAGGGGASGVLNNFAATA